MPLLLSIAISGLALNAQAQTARTLTIEDSTGHVIADAQVRDAVGKALARSDAAGRASFACNAPCAVRVEAAGFVAKNVRADAESIVQLAPAGNAEQVTVTAYRAPMGELESPVTTRVLTQNALQSTAAITADGQIRQLPGVELFRRSSSLVANPSSQGISLRALGSTSASRTLLTLDDVPLNDPVGAWIHWLEQPQLAIANIELLRGGASDLYGSSAIGGVVNVHLAEPAANAFALRSSYGGLGTYADDALGQAIHHAWGVLASGGATGTDGYIQEAPWQRGPVDTVSNVHAQNGLLLAEHKRNELRLFVRGSGFNEARANGTPYQTNGTRLWRYATGGDWQSANGATASLRLYGSTEHYRQAFSSISNLPDFGDASCAYRCGETPTKFTLIADNELGGAAHWSKPLTAGWVLLAGADTHDVRVWDDEQSFGSSAALTDTSVHQRDSGAYVESLYTHRAWTVTAGARMDWFQNYDVQQMVEKNNAWTPGATLPQLTQHVFDPRVGVSRKLSEHWALSASGFRAFRAPSPSELYRSTQVGNQLTLANGALKSERATGWETGVASQRAWGTVRTSYFLTEINRPISAVTINPNSSPILLQRENLGQITSRGVSVDFQIAPRKWLAMDGGYQYAHATVTRGTEESGSQDVGNWIPEVARNMASLNLRAEKVRWGSLSLQSRLSGHQFDDDANTYLLHGYFKLDAYAAHTFGRRVEAFAAAENLLDRTIEVAKTPTTTLGMRRTVRAGFTLTLGAAK
ncbi:TonB-dependent receptor [Terracidiphilus gabretensis]|uniref:TonB-dependent receptor n=1 Tax=Terracidiphilus gabretensis TaxID=1577687 RepID=UPI00071BADA0|nr:TonB-dependent receptor [Terracidiphilus gabretensis]